MNEEILLWMNRTYPGGFYCADLINTSISDSPAEALSILEAPLLVHVNTSQIQHFVSSLIERGVSPNTSCHVHGHNISARLGDIVLKTRTLGMTDIFLVITE